MTTATSTPDIAAKRSDLAAGEARRAVEQLRNDLGHEEAASLLWSLLCDPWTYSMASSLADPTIASDTPATRAMNLLRIAEGFAESGRRGQNRTESDHNKQNSLGSDRK